MISIATLPVGFEDIPSPLAVVVKEQAAFQCSHSSAYSIGWIVNDTTLSVLDNNDITTATAHLTEGSLSTTLRIHARKEYNHTTFKCLAFIDDAPSELSPLAILLIQGAYYNEPVTVIKMFSFDPIVHNNTHDPSRMFLKWGESISMILYVNISNINRDFRCC